MMTVALRKRYGAYWFRVNELIQPHTLMVDRLMHQLGPRPIHTYWDWVITHIRYPYGQIAWDDHHTERAFWRPTWFGRAPLFLYQQNDYWAFPGEVLRDRVGDCKDSAALLTSMLRHRLGPRQVYMSVGYYLGDHGHRHLHAWTTIFLPDGTPLALDTTYSRPLPRDQWVLETPHYLPFWRANEVRTVLLRPDLARKAYGHDLALVPAREASARLTPTRYATG